MSYKSLSRIHLEYRAQHRDHVMRRRLCRVCIVVSRILLEIRLSDGTQSSCVVSVLFALNGRILAISVYGWEGGAVPLAGEPIG
jgi:hypothetical protein